MLAQLVCVDRRYQRMNCFNIREIESILKKRFFVDLINTHDHKKLLHKTIVDLKYRINDNFINPNLFTFYNYGLDFTSKNRSNFLSTIVENKESEINILKENSLFFKTLESFKHSFIYLSINQFFLNNIYFFINTTIIVTFFKKINIFLTVIFLNFFNLFENSTTQAITQNTLFADKNFES